MRLGANDLDRALAVVAEAAATARRQPFELPVIERLLELIPADHAGYFEYGLSGEIYKVEQPVDQFSFDTEQIQALMPEWPLHDQRWGCGTQFAVRFSDVLTPRQRLRNPWYIDVMRQRRVEHEMKLWLPATGGIARGFWLTRSPDGCDFDERDRAVLTVLRRHLTVFRERWERQHRPALLLTRREREVLELVRDGLTNGEIATKLFISAGTVRSHLENIFGKLDVHTRTAALARAFDNNS